MRRFAEIWTEKVGIPGSPVKQNARVCSREVWLGKRNSYQTRRGTRKTASNPLALNQLGTAGEQVDIILNVEHPVPQLGTVSTLACSVRAARQILAPKFTSKRQGAIFENEAQLCRALEHRDRITPNHCPE